MSYTIAMIGSCTTDIIVNLPHLPHSQEDLHIQSHTMSLGGCAWNAAHMLDLFELPYALCMPIGTGMYADYVKKQLSKYHHSSFFPTSKEENGCCYCLVEENGERSFLSYHGAEYHFQKEWFTLLDKEPITTVYICGLEIEEESGTYIIEYLQRHPEITIYFSCGPRISMIDPKRMDALFAMSCILHLNEEEALTYTHAKSFQVAAYKLYKKTRRPVIITLGNKGTYLLEDCVGQLIPSEPKPVVDTIGAGDAHIGTIIAMCSLGYSLYEAIVYANQVSGEVVQSKGSILSPQQFQSIKNQFPLSSKTE